MIIIVCVDDHNGISFNHRRQSMDRKLRDYILKMCKNEKLWMSPYSFKQFAHCDKKNIYVDENYLDKAERGEYCFVENKKVLSYESLIEKIILCRWNRLYPSDMKFDISLNDHSWNCISIDEFSGNSHDKITVEVYER